MTRTTLFATLAGAVALGLTGLSAAAQSGEPIKVGEINHYKRLAAFAEPYKLSLIHI